MSELVNLRQENSKTFVLEGNKRGLLASIGAIHYKNNYANLSEDWKDIDLSWEGNRIVKAPYELTCDGAKLTFLDKKTGEVSTIELLDVKPPGLKWEILLEFSAVRFRHILPSDKVPFEARFRVAGKNIFTKAFDDDGGLELETSLIGDVLTEKLLQVKDKRTGLVRPAKGNIRIDPTLTVQVAASLDDTTMAYTPAPVWNELSGVWYIGNESDYTDFGSAGRFLNITIPPSSIITLANLKLTSAGIYASTVVNARLRAQANINPATFSTAVDFNARTWTTAFVNWDAIPAWVLNTEYTSPNIKTCIQEVINLPGWTSGNPIVVLIDDFELRSTQTGATSRRAFSYDDSTTKAPKLYIVYVPATSNMFLVF